MALRLAIENPGLRVPDPRTPSKVIVVDPRGRYVSPADQANASPRAGMPRHEPATAHPPADPAPHDR